MRGRERRENAGKAGKESVALSDLLRNRGMELRLPEAALGRCAAGIF